MIIYDDLLGICYSTSTSNDLLECANGNFAGIWNGCINQGSVRVRCPQGHFPCNDLAGNGLEFSCWFDCADHGGLKMCQGNIVYIFCMCLVCNRTFVKSIVFYMVISIYTPFLFFRYMCIWSTGQLYSNI